MSLIFILFLFTLATASMASVHFAETSQRQSVRPSRVTVGAIGADVVDSTARVKTHPSKAVSLQGEPWYSEVVEQRHKAVDYKVF